MIAQAANSFTQWYVIVLSMTADATQAVSTLLIGLLDRHEYSRVTYIAVTIVSSTKLHMLYYT